MLSNRKFVFTFLLITLQALLLLEGTGVILAQSVGGTTSGAVTYCTNVNSGVVTVAGYTGNILNWQSSTDGGNVWNSNANTTPNQTYFNLNQTTCYRAIVKDGAFPPDTSTIVCITIYPASVGGTTTGGGSFCDSTGPGMLTLSGHTGSVLNWLSSTNNGSSWTTIANTTVTQNYTNITQQTLFAAVVRTNPACASDTSSVATFIVSPLTDAGTVNSSANVCVTANGGTLTLSGYTGSVLGWESSTDNGTNWTAIANTTDSLVYLNLNQFTLYRAIVQSGVCSVDTTPVVVLNVSPETVTGTISGGGVYCGVPATGILNLSGYTGAILNWLSSTDNGATWNSISNTSNAENYTNLPVTTLYRVVVQSGTCSIDTSAIETVSVAPQTVAGTISGGATVCAVINEDTLLLSGNVGSVNGWLSSTDNGFTWILIANTSASQEYSGLTQTTAYAAIVQSGACDIDTTLAVTIVVEPLPTVNAGSDVSIVQGESAVLTGSGSGTPLWIPSTGLSDATVFAPTATPSATITYVLSVTAPNNCVNADSILVTVIQNTFGGKVSNLFTPNGDGVNDTWHVEGIQNYPENEVFVYNIYGNEVYSTQAYANDWRGTYNDSELPDGTYYYVIIFDGGNSILRGSVDILRSK